VSSPMFLFAQQLESGLARDYLKEECRVEQLTPCKYLDNLPRDANDFLWGWHPLLREMGGVSKGRDEASKIAWGSIRRYPVRFAADSAKRAAQQFIIFKPDDENFPMPIVDQDLEKYSAKALSKYQLTRQYRGWLVKLAEKTYPIYAVIFWVSLVGSVLFGFSRRSSGPANQLLVLMVFLLAANALVTSVVGGVYNRYQGRIDWLPSLSSVLYVVSLWPGRLVVPRFARSGANEATLTSGPGRHEAQEDGPSGLVIGDSR